MKHLIIYHFEDNDGVCSCALVKQAIKYRERYGDTIDLLPSNYASLAKLVEDNDFDEYFGQYDYIYMTDISFNDWHCMKRLYDLMGDHLYWFDHHAPIINDSHEHGFDDIPGFRDTGRSAILCVYHHFWDQVDSKYKDGEIPTILRLLSAWDCWSWAKEGLSDNFIRSFNVGVNTKGELKVDYFMNNMRWLLMDGEHDDVYHYPLDSNKNVLTLIEQYCAVGREIIDRQDKANEGLISGYGEEGWYVDGEKNAVMVVTSGPSNSQMFKSVADRFDHGIVIKHTKDGKWTVSLYNTREDVDFDCGKYLKQKYNGGGHKGAAGCTLDNTQFFKVIQDKVL